MVIGNGKFAKRWKMGKPVIKWSMAKMVWMITKIVQNKFDLVLTIDGNTGMGKSTLAIQLARGVSREMKKQGKKDYKFNWRNSLLYNKKDTKQFLHKWKSIGIIDEGIGVVFNRDFYNEDQKDILKLINMSRDHNNLIIFCVPSFQTIDNQLKNLCKMRITVVRRGLCIIQTPQQSLYLTDKWDQQTNSKIEREWMAKGIKNPKYSRLTTFRGIMKFPALTEQQEEKYQKVKDDKRNQVAEEEMGIKGENAKEKDPVEIMCNMLIEGKIRNAVYVDGFAVGNNLDPYSLKRKVITTLKKRGVNHKIADYYWDKKIKKNIESNGGFTL